MPVAKGFNGAEDGVAQCLGIGFGVGFEHVVEPVLAEHLVVVVAGFPDAVGADDDGVAGFQRRVLGLVVLPIGLDGEGDVFASEFFEGRGLVALRRPDEDGGVVARPVAMRMAAAMPWPVTSPSAMPRPALASPVWVGSVRKS